MKKMKKFFAILMAMVMVMGMSVTVLADSITTSTPINGEPKNTDRVLVEITGLENGTKAGPDNTTITASVDVALYQIAEPEYDPVDNTGFIRYVWTEQASGYKNTSGEPVYKAGEQVSFPTNGETTLPLTTEAITGIANSLSGTAYDTVSGVTDGSYTKEVEAGIYIAVITGSTHGYVYNPVLLTASYGADSSNTTTLVGGSINVANAKYLNGSTAVAKRKEPDVKKEIENPVKVDIVNGENIVTGSVGDAINYKITPTLPSYPANASNKTFFVSDLMAEGLTFDYSSLRISIGDQPVNTKYRTDTNGNLIRQYYYGADTVFAESVKTVSGTQEGFNINFTYENLISDSVTGDTYQPIITYRAIINDAAVAGSTGNTNDVTMLYSKTPNTGTDWDTPTTPPPSGPDQSTGADYGEKTDREVVYTYQLAFQKTDDNAANPTALSGAVFGIYRTGNVADKTVSGLIDTVTTNNAGYAVSSKVGAGTYYIKEITAPDGYSLNDEVFEIQAKWDKATSTTTTTTVTNQYTSDSSKVPAGAPQVGWLVGDGEGTFHKINAYEARVENDATVIYDMSNNMPATTNVRAAYLVSTTTTVSSENATITNGTAAGSGVVLKPDAITDTKLTALPSTGGIGTTIFTIGGCAIMILAAGLYFASRRKSAR